MGPRNSYRLLERNHYLSTHVGLVKEWRQQDVVAFSQLVDFTGIESVRRNAVEQGTQRPTYTAFVIDAVARALRLHPKLNRMVYRGLAGYRWVQFENIDIAVASELVENDVDMAYLSILRDADRLGLQGIMRSLQQLSAAPAEDPQLKRLRRFPPALTVALARVTGLHPKLWTRFRGGSCAITSPAKYGTEMIVAKTSWPMQFAFGKVAERPMVVEGQCVPRRSAYLSMAWHRELTTGAVAARFFEQVIQNLEQARAATPQSQTLPPANRAATAP